MLIGEGVAGLGQKSEKFDIRKEITFPNTYFGCRCCRLTQLLLNG